MSTGVIQTANASAVAARGQERSSLGQAPVVTLGLAALAVAASLLPTAFDWLSYDRAAITAGEAWRLVTGHFTHWNTDHLLWDAVMFVVLGAAVERASRGGLATTLVIASAAISATLWTFAPEVSQYRGLSGLDSALFGFVAPQLFYEALQMKRRGMQWLLALLSIGFAGKIAYEMATGQTVFVDSAAAAFTPLPVVHVVGAVVGFCVLAVSRRRSDSTLQGSHQCN